MGTRNVCSFNYTAVIKIEPMKTELAQLFADHDIAIPDGFDGLRHTVNGGTSGTLSQTRTRSPVCSLVCRWKRVKGCSLSMNAILPCLIMSMKWRVIEFINSIQYGIHTHSVAATVMHNENFCA